MDTAPTGLPADPHHRRWFMVALLGSVSTFASHDTLAAEGEEFPRHPLKLLVPFPASGPSDMTARIVAPRMSVELKQPVVVENRPSAGGAVGTEMVARGPADGYTILVATTSVLVGAPLVNAESVRYDPLKDFVALGIVSQSTAVIYVNSRLGIESVDQLVKRARDSSKPVSYASSGIGTLGHLSVATFEHHYGLKMLHVPYKGTGQLITDFVAGQVDVALMDVAGAAEHVKAGTLRPLFIASLQRREDMSGVPSMRDLGMDKVDFTGWNGLFVSSRTPPKLRRILATALQRTMGDPDVLQKIRERNMTPLFQDEVESDHRIRSEIAAWNVAVKPMIMNASNR